MVFSQTSPGFGGESFHEDPSGFVLHTVTDGSGQEDRWLIVYGSLSVVPSFSAEGCVSSYDKKINQLLLQPNAG